MAAGNNKHPPFAFFQDTPRWFGCQPGMRVLSICLAVEHMRWCWSRHCLFW